MIIKTKKGEVPLVGQSGPWQDEVMVQPPYQRYRRGRYVGELDPDTIGEWFCLGASCVNIMNLRAGEYKETPRTLNRKIREKNGYLYLADPENCPVGKEAFIVWPVLMEIMGAKSRDDNYTGNFYFDDPDEYYIGREALNDTGHYSIVIGGEPKAPKVFCSYLLEEKIIEPTRIIKVCY